MYRLLKADRANRSRRRCRTHPHYKAPEILATRPNELWSWDITRLKGPHKLTGYKLYVMLDVFSRYVVGWTVAHREDQNLAAQLMDEACHRQRITPDRLTIHADRGGPMTSKTVALLLSDLGVLKTHSRPRVSNDNPFSESHFKTLKYCPDFPDRFGSIEHARDHCRRFFDWYNNEHHHTGLADLTPAVVHHGRDRDVIAQRQALLDAAYQRNPRRFVHGRPMHPSVPSAVWINPPTAARDTVQKGEHIPT
jgi:putative transposase